MELVELIPMIALSALAFWKPDPALFMMAGAAAFLIGIYWYDAYATNLGLVDHNMILGSYNEK